MADRQKLVDKFSSGDIATQTLTSWVKGKLKTIRLHSLGLDVDIAIIFNQPIRSIKPLSKGG
jgi:hypothetical protein